MGTESDTEASRTASNEFKADVIRSVPINFDALELSSYIEGYQLRIRLGIMDNPGSKNELTLEADNLPLEPGMKYDIGPPPFPIQASFGLEGYLEYLPKSYSGNLSVNHLSDDGAGKASIDVSFSIKWQTGNGEGMEVKCSTLRLST
ncbi:hypothetical protein [Pseudomonas sp. S1_E04]